MYIPIGNLKRFVKQSILHQLNQHLDAGVCFGVGNKIFFQAVTVEPGAVVPQVAPVNVISLILISPVALPGLRRAVATFPPSSAPVKAEYFSSHACFGNVQTVQCPSKRFKRGVSSLSVVSYHAHKLSCFTPSAFNRWASSKLHTCYSNGIIMTAKLFCKL